ncbi:hypothetical protein D3C78_1578230 [compost metagenome]
MSGVGEGTAYPAVVEKLCCFMCCIEQVPKLMCCGTVCIDRCDGRSAARICHPQCFEIDIVSGEQQIFVGFERSD